MAGLLDRRQMRGRFEPGRLLLWRAQAIPPRGGPGRVVGTILAQRWSPRPARNGSGTQTGWRRRGAS
ncbi:hypothetical protein, partial [Xanthomonas perforans]|uniref:hypothetical protein n=1 Tax=Xanthomonas perforans TaxID=442694 RepID=UPI001F40B9B7